MTGLRIVRGEVHIIMQQVQPKVPPKDKLPSWLLQHVPWTTRVDQWLAAVRRGVMIPATQFLAAYQADKFFPVRVQPYLLHCVRGAMCVRVCDVLLHSAWHVHNVSA